MGEKELFYENVVFKHKNLVSKYLSIAIDILLHRSEKHDLSKFSHKEKEGMIAPIWYLNHNKVDYDSDEYKNQIVKMGESLKIHFENNDHHPEFFENYKYQTDNDAIKAMDLFTLMEMLCDWLSAAKRRGNDAIIGLKVIEKKYPLDPQLRCIIANTLQIFQNRDKNV